MQNFPSTVVCIVLNLGIRPVPTQKTPWPAIVPLSFHMSSIQYRGGAGLREAMSFTRRAPIFLASVPSSGPAIS
jgi:hypothetical protein